MAELNSTTIALLAQLVLAESSGWQASAIDVSVYRAWPDFGAVAAVNEAYASGSPMPVYEPDSWLGFVFSKPAHLDERLAIHVLEVLDSDGVDTGERWLKLKSRAALLHQAQANTTTAADVQRELLQRLGYDTESLSVDIQPLASGPDWLNTAIAVNIAGPGVRLVLPVVITPLDVPARFAGHYYLKLILPDHSALAGKLSAAH